MSKPYCERRQALFSEFQRAMGDYTKAVAELTMSETQEEFSESKKNAEAARHRTVATRAELDRHIEEHGC